MSKHPWKYASLVPAFMAALLLGTGASPLYLDSQFDRSRTIELFSMQRPNARDARRVFDRASDVLKTWIRLPHEPTILRAATASNLDGAGADTKPSKQSAVGNAGPPTVAPRSKPVATSPKSKIAAKGNTSAGNITSSTEASPAETETPDRKDQTHGPVIRQTGVLIGIIGVALFAAAIPLAFCFFCGCCTVAKVQQGDNEFDDMKSYNTSEDPRGLKRNSVRKSLDCSAVLPYYGIPKSAGTQSLSDESRSTASTASYEPSGHHC